MGNTQSFEYYLLSKFSSLFANLPFFRYPEEIWACNTLKTDKDRKKRRRDRQKQEEKRREEEEKQKKQDERERK